MARGERVERCGNPNVQEPEVKWGAREIRAKALKNRPLPCYAYRVDWERVHTVNDYDDGPRLGVAEVFGHPHIYESPFSEL